MNGTTVTLVIALIGIAALFMARSRAFNLAGGDISKLHSRPVYYGSHAAIWSIIPAMLIFFLGMSASVGIIERNVRASFPADVQQMAPADQNIAFGMVSAIGIGLDRLSPEELAPLASDMAGLKDALASKGVPLAAEPKPWMIDSAHVLDDESAAARLVLGAVAIIASLIGAFWSLSRIQLTFRARNAVERVMLAGLVLSSTIAILTTVGIIFSLLTETIHFFSVVPLSNFFFGTVWDPRFSAAGSDASGQFGLIPLLLGTVYIALVAMLFAVPVGLYAAIYMSEYASKRVRTTVKPLLEMLAGIPTIVYGFFALVTAGPWLRDFSTALWGAVTGQAGGFIEAQSVLTAGLVMGIRLIPFVSSLSDDIITAVPRSLRDGSLGLGATRSETMRRVILPAALPGIVGALLLTASRAIGETMIVVLAAGVAANLQFSPFKPMTTVTVKIVNQLTGDLEFTSPQTLVAFALGMTLFVMTLCLNIYALYIVRKYREQYE